MNIFKEFKQFILRGNIIELAVAVIIGAAFSSIVSSLVEDIITPILLTPALNAAKVHEIASLSWNGIKYGNFLAALLKFMLIAGVLFFLLKAVNSILKRNATENSTPSTTDALLAEIRDELKKARE